eukprot:1334817-Prymnesium_polylepis.1
MGALANRASGQGLRELSAFAAWHEPPALPHGQPSTAHPLPHPQTLNPHPAVRGPLAAPSCGSSRRRGARVGCTARSC